MSKITASKKGRLLDWRKDRGVFKRIEPLPAEPMHNIGDCFFCHHPVFASTGQWVTKVERGGNKYPTHKKCRQKQARKH